MLTISRITRNSSDNPLEYVQVQKLGGNHLPPDNKLKTSEVVHISNIQTSSNVRI